MTKNKYRAIKVYGIAFFLAAILSSFLFALEGGPARLMALGAPELVVLDASIDVNLYGDGYFSSIFKKGNLNVISLFLNYSNTYYWNLTSDIYSSSRKYIRNDLNTGYDDKYSKNIIILYPSPDFAVLFRPCGFYNSGTLKWYDAGSSTPSDTNIFNVYVFGGEVEIAKKFSKNFALSGLIGALKLSQSSHFDPTWTPGVRDIYYIKPEFNISASFLPNENDGWEFALRYGNDDISMFPINNLKLLQSYNSFDDNYIISNSGLYTKYLTPVEDSVTITRGANSIYTFDNYFKAGTSFHNSTIDFCLNLGIMGSPASRQTNVTYFTDKATGKVTTQKGIPYDYSNYGIGSIIDFVYRLRSNYIITGIKGNFSNLYTARGKNYIADVNTYYGRAIAGVNFIGIKGLNIPIECFYEISSLYTTNYSVWDDMINYDYGINAGVEYSISKNFSIRAGSIYGNVSFIRDNGATKGPINHYLSYTAGIGFKVSNFEINIGTIWQTESLSQMIPGYKIGQNVINGYIDISNRF